MTVKDKIALIDLDKIADTTSRAKVQAFMNKVEAQAESSPEDAMNLIEGLIGKLILSNPQAVKSKISKAEAEAKVEKIKKMKNIVPQKADIVKIKSQISKQYPTWDDDKVDELAKIRIQAQEDRADSIKKMIDNLEKTNLYAGKVSNAPIDYVAPKEPSRVMRNRSLPKDAKTKAITEADELRTTKKKFKRKSPTFGKAGGAKRPYYYEYRMNRRDVDSKIQLAKGGYADPENATHVLHIDGQNWFLEKIDSTHFYMSNDPDFRGMAHHIGQHKGESYYDEIRQWLMGTKFEKGGNVSIPNAEKMMHLPMEVAVYVPSTSNVDKEISASEMKSRVKEVETYLAETFGGFTSSEKVGGYMSGNSGIVTEKVVPVTAFATSESFSKNKSKLVNKMAVWAKKWGQEAMGLEFEGDLYYVPQKFKQGGRLTATYIPNEDIESIKTRFGQTFKGKDILDGAYVKRKVITPKVTRTQFEEEEFEYGKGGSVENYTPFDTQKAGKLSGTVFTRSDKGKKTFHIVGGNKGVVKGGKYGKGSDVYNLFDLKSEYGDTISAQLFDEYVNEDYFTIVSKNKFAKGGSTRQYEGLNAQDKFIADQIYHVMSLRSISEKKDVIKNSILPNLDIYNLEKNPKRIVKDNLGYALTLKSISSLNNTLEATINALRSSHYAKGGKTPPRAMNITFTDAFFEQGRSVNNPIGKFGSENPELVNFDLDELDNFEQMQYEKFVQSMPKAEALQIIINGVEGDYSQLSEALATIAEKQEPSDMYAKGGGIGDYKKVRTFEDILNDPRVSDAYREDVDGEKMYWMNLKNGFVSIWEGGTSIVSENMQYLKDTLNTKGVVLTQEEYNSQDDEYAKGGGVENKRVLFNRLKEEVITDLSEKYKVAPSDLIKFNFDGKDDMKELAKVLNNHNPNIYGWHPTSLLGVEKDYLRMIASAKRRIGFGGEKDMYAKGGGVRTPWFSNHEYSYGRNWTNDHRHENKAESHEVPEGDRKNKMAKGGSVSPKGGQFMIDYCWSDVYVDDYEQGEMDSKGTIEHDFMVGEIFDFEDLFDILDSNLGLSTDPSHYTIVDNKILTSRLEDADGEEPTKSEIESWKKGQTTLYVAHYTIGLKIVVVTDTTDETLSSITKINIE